MGTESIGNRNPGPFAAGSRYNAYGSFLKSKFGCRVYKVVVDAGFSCPNRDGTVGLGGCTYCNNDSFKPKSVVQSNPVEQQVSEGIDYLRARYRACKFIVYFQPFSNTHAPVEALRGLYRKALINPDVVGLAIGTRPDCIDDAKLELLQDLAHEYFITVEYGLESIHDSTLLRINRGHDFTCSLDAVKSTRNRGIWISAHLILGFPWETHDQMMQTAFAISHIGIDFLKLHHLHIVRHTALGREYERCPFQLLNFEEYVDLVVDFLERLNPAVKLERLFGLAPEEYLIGPIWGKTKAEIQYAIERRLALRNTYQGRLHSG
jgi:radical SAM protein (TIGR01212 family)